MYSDTEIHRRRQWTKIVTKAVTTSTRDVELAVTQSRLKTALGDEKIDIELFVHVFSYMSNVSSP